jgi:hypothetical protein
MYMYLKYHQHRVGGNGTRTVGPAPPASRDEACTVILYELMPMSMSMSMSMCN